ncbi:RNA polymerase sigma-70 factor [Kutzneria buriramensis]|uniref:RNA polymerase sigma-70 factor (ECF subfamily) n=1 Tax=Kutzneria buriramensis TaxID=1045776 RepID=A0A3E0GUS5_9PSEU|nr:RNA polymerase sigma-70 factor [Kutzneria buriramensis]REH26175.1 RNA polymerase sigma-70 factor (ECF subfamily) [Kutzneria buriramensis]
MVVGGAEALAQFDEVRPSLFGIAYRMLGSVADAEDVLQEAWLRWARTDLDDVRNPAAFLTTVTTRLAITAVTSARARREVYVGPWLPEPVSTADDPTLGAERAEALDLAVLLLLERLPARERAAYVLREAFDYSFRDIAEVLETTEANARQLARRARVHLADERHAPVAPAERSRLLGAFLAAATSGDLAALEKLLTEDAVSYSDGGGVVSAARMPVVGRERVARFIAGMATKFGTGLQASIVDANGGQAVLMTRDGEPVALIGIDAAADGVRRSLMVVNPAKLAGLVA